MADRKYFVLCEQNCKFESMTKEQILSAITQAVSEGTIGDIDTGFVTTVKTINGASVKFFYGTSAEYNALSEEEKQNLCAILTNDNEELALILENLKSDVETLESVVNEKAPAYTYGTEDLTAGVSPLESGKLYFVYE